MAGAAGQRGALSPGELIRLAAQSLSLQDLRLLRVRDLCGMRITLSPGSSRPPPVPSPPLPGARDTISADQSPPPTRHSLLRTQHAMASGGEGTGRGRPDPGEIVMRVAQRSGPRGTRRCSRRAGSGGAPFAYCFAAFAGSLTFGMVSNSTLKSSPFTFSTLRT